MSSHAIASFSTENLFAPTREAERDNPPPVIARAPHRLSKEALAMAYLIMHPSWSNGQIAEAIGCSRTSIYRWKLFTAARRLLKQQGMANLLGGSKYHGDLEAWERDDDDE